MKILLTNKNAFWKLDMPYIQEHLDEVIYVNYYYSVWNDKEPEQEAPNQFNIPEYVCCGSPSPGYGSGDYREAEKCVPKFEEMVDRREDLVFLCDTSYSSLYLFRALYDHAHRYNVHLVLIHANKGEEYNNFFLTRLGDRRQMQNKLLFIDKLKSVVSIKEGLEERLDVSIFLETICNQIRSMKNGTTYVFNHREKVYEENKITMRTIEESENVISPDFESVMLAGVPYPDNFNGQQFSLDSPRLDGKEVCAVLKKMRRELVDANGLEIEIAECDNDEMCAGTCPMCELEVARIEAAMSEIPEEDRVYPKFDVAEEMLKVRGEDDE